MIHPSSRYRFSRTESSGRSKFKGTVIVILLLFGAATGAFFLLRHPVNAAAAGNTHAPSPVATVAALQSAAGGTAGTIANGTPSSASTRAAQGSNGNSVNPTPQAIPAVAKSDLPTLWKDQRYTEIISATGRMLGTDPMDPVALAFNGFANFYLGITQVSPDDKQQYMEQAITSLRRTLLVSHVPYPAQVHYVLGKAYYQDGQYYTDLAIDHLNRALTLGYRASDIYEFLGLSYSRVGYYQKAIDSFLKALDDNPKDVLYYTIAQTYNQMQNYGDALRYAQKAIDSSNDDFLVQKARFLLGDVYLSQKKYDDAEQQYRKILDASPQSADAHYYLGEVYAARGDRVAARHEWVEAIRIDPNNALASKRLSGR